MSNVSCSLRDQTTNREKKTQNLEVKKIVLLFLKTNFFKLMKAISYLLKPEYRLDIHSNKPIRSVFNQEIFTTKKTKQK